MTVRGLGCALALALTVACKPRPAHQPPSPEPPAAAEAAVTPPAEETATLNAHAPELTISKSAQVSVLCYHDFTTGKSNNDMVLNIGKFRQQMQALKDAKITVISLDHYLAWRRGEKDMPDAAVLITMDDGWKSVHTLAFPVLKEFGYPFTVFLYRDYVDGGGRALTTPLIRELMDGGGTIGSHSVSHPYPPEFRARAKQPPEEYAAWVEKEFRESKDFLEQKFGVRVPAFAYPGGYYTADMAKKGREVWGYEALFTCNGVRTSWDTPLAEIGRFIVLGTDEEDRAFRAATNFGGGGEGLGRRLLGGEIGEDGQPRAPLVVVTPGENETITGRRPRIEVDLSRLTDIEPDSVTMRIPGFGLVPATYNVDTGRLIYQPLQVLRAPEIAVHVRLQRTGQEKPDVISWKFFIDQKAHYLTLAEPPSAPAAPPASSAPER